MIGRHVWWIALPLLAACTPSEPDRQAASAPPPAAGVMDELAESYVRLVLATGAHDPDYVDAYYGPVDWRQQAQADLPTLEQIEGEVEELLEGLAALPEPAEEIEALRLAFLQQQTRSLSARLEILGGRQLTFDEESLALYGAVVPPLSEAHFQAVLDELAAELPGEGPLIDRYETYRRRFVIPPERLDAVFQAALEGCRSRTLAHIDLPESERFRVEYVTDKPWSGYNWFQGGFESLIQVNTDLPIYIERAIGLACHEGYPGHHVYNLLLEKHLVQDRGWVELTVYPLYSPQSLIAEGTANYGEELAFPPAERIAFEREILYPLAGLDPAEAARYHHIMGLMERLSYAGNEAARRYLDGEIDAAETTRWLQQYQLNSPDRAQQRIRFFDTYRAYVINYTLGQDLTRAYVEGRAGDDPDRRWEVFHQLLTTPRVPSGLGAS